MDRTRVLVLDDSEVARAGMVAALQSRDVDVVGAAADVDDAVRLAAQRSPHVALVDVRLGSCNGIDAAHKIVQASPSTRILFVTAFHRELDSDELARAAESGIVLKSVPLYQLIAAVDETKEGRTYVDPVIARELIDVLSRNGGRRSPLEQLTDRERQVFELLRLGRSNSEIASELGVSSKTVKNHVSSVLAKLGLSRRSQVPAFSSELDIGCKRTEVQPDDFAGSRC